MSLELTSVLNSVAAVTSGKCDTFTVQKAPVPPGSTEQTHVDISDPLVSACDKPVVTTDSLSERWGNEALCTSLLANLWRDLRDLIV